MPKLRAVGALLVVAFAVAVSQSFGRFTYSVLLTDIRTDLGISNTVSGSLGSANLAAYLLGTLVVSLVVGRFGLISVARWGLAAVTVGLALLGWSPSITIVAFGLVITGFSAAGVWVTAPAIAIAELGDDRRGTAIGLVTTGVGSGMMIASWLDTQVEWRSVYRIEVVVAVVVTTLSFTLIRADETRPTARLGLSAIRDIPGWRPLVAAYGLFGAGMALVTTFLVALLEDDAGYESNQATAAFLVLAAGSVVGGPFHGWFTDAVGRRAGLTTAFVLMAASTVVMATGHKPGATVAAFVFGTSFAGVPIGVAAVVSDYASDERFGAAFGAATLLFGVGLTFGPQVGGVVADISGSFRPTFAIATTAALVGALLAWWSIPSGGSARSTAAAQ